MRIVIIGNSAAAVGCIEGIRRQDTESEILLVSKEPYHTYSRPLISYLLEGKTDEQRMKYRPDDFYTKNKVETRLGVSVTAINSEKHEITLETGETEHYDKLLAATGSRPFVPNIQGLETVKNRFTFQSLDDAEGLRAALTPDSRVLIVGAGLIGLKCAEGIYSRVGSITVVDMAERVLPSILDEEGAQRMQKHLEGKGIKFFLGDCAEEFEKNKTLLKSGAEVEFDILVLAVGVRPNTELILADGGEVRRGVVTDSHCRTDLADVYAAGDCAESHDVASDSERVLALLPNAYMQGERAGEHMVLGDCADKYDKAIAMNAIGLFGLHMLTAGSYDGESVIRNDGGTYKRLFVKDDKLKGYILIGDVSRGGIYTALIRNETPLSSIDFDLIAEKPQLMAFSRSKRSELLNR